MRSIKTGFLLVFALLFARGAEARTLNWQGLGRTNLMSSMLPMDAEFRFELGVFKSGFVPTETNVSQWATNWVAAQRTNYNAVTRIFAGSHHVTNNVAPMTNGARFYYWGFRGSEVSGEWILITRSNWSWPAADDSLPALTYSTGLASAVLGVVNTNTNAPFHLQSAAVTNARPPATSWPQWALSELGTVPPAGPSGDLNTNGITDALEYAMHSGESSNPASWLQIGQTNGNKHLEIRIPRRRDRPASYVVEVSTNLQNWTNGPAFTEIVEDSAAALIVRDKTPVGDGGDRRFMRVRTVVTP